LEVPQPIFWFPWGCFFFAKIPVVTYSVLFGAAHKTQIGFRMLFSILSKRMEEMQENWERKTFFSKVLVSFSRARNFFFFLGMKNGGKEPDRQVDPLERKCLSFPSLSGYY